MCPQLKMPNRRPPRSVGSWGKAWDLPCWSGRRRPRSGGMRRRRMEAGTSGQLLTFPTYLKSPSLPTSPSPSTSETNTEDNPEDTSRVGSDRFIPHITLKPGPSLEISLQKAFLKFYKLSKQIQIKYCICAHFQVGSKSKGHESQKGRTSALRTQRLFKEKSRGPSPG